MAEVTDEFAGARKTNNSLLAPFEHKMSCVLVARIPSWIETYHLTLLSFVWCSAIIAFSYLAASDLRWLAGVSIMIALQYLTDFFDGKVGILRGTGLVRWGFYLDHFLDYLFLCSLVIGYALVLPPTAHLSMLLTFAVFGAYMVHSFLLFAATEEFEISSFRLGPTEFRVALIIINTLLMFYGTKAMVKPLPFVAGGALIGLGWIVYRAQKRLWRIDMERRQDSRDLSD